MIKSGDIEGRLRLLRYGLVVLVVVTFLVAMLAPMIMLRFVTEAGFELPTGDFLGTAVLLTVVVAVLSVIVYFVYASFLKKSAT